MTTIKCLKTLDDWYGQQEKCTTALQIAKLFENFWLSVDVSVPAIRDKLEHVKRVVSLADSIYPDNDVILASACAHDIGRVLQYYLLGKFDDRTVLHHHLGTQIFEQLMFKNVLQRDDITDTISMVIEYHGRKNFKPSFDIPEEILSVLEIISAIDDVDNGCVGAIGYLDREIDDDVKKYGKDNQKVVAKEVFEFFSKGEKFDKMKYCKTYADYVLFACVLAIQSLKNQEYKEIAVEALEMQCVDSYGTEYKSALEAYRSIFKRRLDEDMAERCYKILISFYEEAKG